MSNRRGSVHITAGLLFIVLDAAHILGHQEHEDAAAYDEHGHHSENAVIGDAGNLRDNAEQCRSDYG